MDAFDFKHFNGLSKHVIRNRSTDTDKNKVNWMKMKTFGPKRTGCLKLILNMIQTQTFPTLMVNQGW